jgi:hypothetical protein
MGELACMPPPPKPPTTGLMTTPLPAATSDSCMIRGVVTDCAEIGTKTLGRRAAAAAAALEGEKTGVAGREEPLRETSMLAASILAALSPSLSRSRSYQTQRSQFYTYL